MALIRGPGMVVNYQKAGSDTYQNCVGVFNSHPDIEKILTYSEPQIHNEWDSNSDRLKRKFEDDGIRVVKRVASVIERNFKDFQRLQESPVPPGSAIFTKTSVLPHSLPPFYSSVLRGVRVAVHYTNNNIFSRE